MTLKSNPLLIFAFFALFLLNSCDDEAIDPAAQNVVETLAPNSTLVGLMEDVSVTDNLECVDFVYPITFTLYNTNFQVVETVTIQSDTALFEFLNGLVNSENGVVLASLDFPVSLVYDNGNTVEVNNNQELEAAIQAASENCGDTSACDMGSVRDYLVSCSQVPTLNDFTPSFTTFEFYDSNELFTMYELDLPHSGTWDIAMIDGEIKIFINFNGLENFNGEYSIVDCSENTLVLQQGDDTLILTKQCNNGGSVIDCMTSTDAQLTACDNGAPGFATFDLTSVFANCIDPQVHSLSYFMSLADAETNSNQISMPSSFTNISNPQTIYVRLEIEGTSVQEIFEIELLVEDCECNNPGVSTNDLVIYMPFGNEVKDLISGNEVANVSNNYVTDRSGNSSCAIGFDGNQSFSIPVTTQNELVEGDSFSISLWFKMQNNNAGDLEIFFRKPGNATVGFNFGVYDLNSPLFFDNLGVSLWDNDWNQEVDVQWENTDWHHLVVTVDSSNTIRLYRDGVLRNTVENSNLTIGDQGGSEYLIGESFVGHLDDLRVYKRALTPNDIHELYNLDGECYQCL